MDIDRTRESDYFSGDSGCCADRMDVYTVEKCVVVYIIAVMPDFDGTSGHYNREMAPGFFICQEHTDHAAECFVAFGTSEGTEAIPVCWAIVEEVKSELATSQGIRFVSPKAVTSFHGTIYGFAANI